LKNLSFIARRKFDLIKSKYQEPALRRAGKRYIEENKIPLFKGVEDEISAIPFDLYNLHKTVIERKPKCILKFGVGFSTLVLCHALMSNRQGRLYSVDTSEEWLENTRAKLPNDAPVDLIHSSATAKEINGELCHTFDHITDVIPNMVYLDGPYGPDVQGAINGLSFNGTSRRTEISADMLLLESTLPASFILVVDGRDRNQAFLRRNLKRHYKIKSRPALKFTTFELVG
jgi:hypothetical protein